MSNKIPGKLSSEEQKYLVYLIEDMNVKDEVTKDQVGEAFYRGLNFEYFKDIPFINTIKPLDNE